MSRVSGFVDVLCLVLVVTKGRSAVTRTCPSVVLVPSRVLGRPYSHCRPLVSSLSLCAWFFCGTPTFVPTVSPVYGRE